MKVITHRENIGTLARDSTFLSSMPEDKNSLVIEVLVDFLENTCPTFDRTSAIWIDKRMPAVEDEVTDVRHVCILKVDHRITAGMSRPVVLRLDHLIADSSLPGLLKSGVGVNLAR